MANFLINLMLNLCLMLDSNAFSDFDSGSLQAWADPTDGKEAIYFEVDPEVCRVILNPDTHIVEIDFTDACDV